jgi:2'-5' RNA ligase
VRWVRPQGVHLTLKFLGEIDPALTESILAAMGRAATAVRPFTLSLSGLGAFPRPEAPRVIWAGLEAGVDDLKRLQERTDQEVSAAAGLPRETRSFTPHLTLGRVSDSASGEERGRLGAALGELRLEVGETWRVEKLDLIRSTLTPGGAVYDVMGSRTLSSP